VKAHALVPSDASAERLVGWVLTHDVRDAAGALLGRKGDRLDPAGAARLVAGSHEEVHVLEMEPGDLHEDPAGERVARAVAGAGVSVRDSASGQWAIVAGQRGILRVATASLAAVNGLEGVSVYTLFDGQVVDAGEVVARAKVTPLVIAESVVREVEERSRQTGGCVAVGSFHGQPVGAVAPASLSPRARARFEAVLREKLDWFGAPLAGLAYRAETAALGQAVQGRSLPARASSSSPGATRSTRSDPVFTALGDRWPARPERRAGAPGESPVGRARGVDPGARHAGVRHVLPGDPLRPAAPAPPGGGDGRTGGPRGVRSRGSSRARDGLPVPALPCRA
jgi:hypothetical protein